MTTLTRASCLSCLFLIACAPPEDAVRATGSTQALILPSDPRIEAATKVMLESLDKEARAVGTLTPILPKERPNGRLIVRFRVAIEGTPVAILSPRVDVEAGGKSLKIVTPLRFADAVLPVDWTSDVGLGQAEAAAADAVRSQSNPKLVNKPVHSSRLLRPTSDAKGMVTRLDLAYLVLVGDPSELPHGHTWVWVHAGTGRVQSTHPAWSELGGRGLSFHSGPVAIEIDEEPDLPGVFALRDSRYPGSETYSAEGGSFPYYSYGPFSFLPVQGDDDTFGTGAFANDVSQAQGLDGETSAVDVHYAYGHFNDFLGEVLGRNGPNGDGTHPPQIANVLIVDPMGNIQRNAMHLVHPMFPQGVVAYSLPLGTGWPPTTPEIVAHENTHALFSKELISADNPSLVGEQLHIAEGVSDVFGVMFEMWIQSPGTAIPNIGDVWTMNTNQNSIRYFHKPSRDGASPDWYSDTMPTDPHLSSGPLRRAFYFLAQGVKPKPTFPWPGSLDKWYEFGSLWLERGFKGLGNDQAFHILYQAIASDEMNDYPDYAEVRRAMVEVVKVPNTCTEQQLAVEDAFAAVHVGAPGDRVAPALSLSVAQATGVVRVTTTASDNDALAETFSLSVNGFAVPFAGPLNATVDVPIASLPQFGQTTYTFALQIADRCGNKTSRSSSLVVDLTGPLVWVTEIPGTAMQSKSLTVTASDPRGLAGFHLILPGLTSILIPYPMTGTNATRTLTYSFAGSKYTHGTHPVSVVVNDVYGNATTRTWQSLFDKQAPASCSPQVSTNGLSATFWGSARDADSGIRWVAFDIDEMQIGVDTTAASDGQTYGPMSRTLTRGVHYFRVRCSDQYRNERAFTVSSRLTAPPTARLSTTGLFRHQIVISYGGSDDEGVVRSQLRFDGGTIFDETRTPSTSFTESHTIPLTNYASGTSHTIRFTVTDAEDQSASIDLPFTVPSGSPPQPQDEVFQEVEPNNWYVNWGGTWNQVPASADAIVGSVALENSDAFYIPWSSGNLTINFSGPRNFGWIMWFYNPMQSSWYPLGGRSNEPFTMDIAAAYDWNRGPVSWVVLTIDYDYYAPIEYRANITRN